jgi:hypothetical protein
VYRSHGVRHSIAAVKWNNSSILVSSIGFNGLCELACANPLLESKSPPQTQFSDYWQQKDKDWFAGTDCPWDTDAWHWFDESTSDSSKSLVIVFSGLGFPNSKPSFIFRNILKQFTTVDKLFLRDLSKQYYLRGLGDMNLTTLLGWIESLISRKKYSRVVTIGCSAGGYAAILFGNLLSVDRAIAFSPQTVISRVKERQLGDYRFTNVCNFPRLWESMSEEGAGGGSTSAGNLNLERCMDLRLLLPLRTRVELHYSAENGLDCRHGERMKHNGGGGGGAGGDGGGGDGGCGAGGCGAGGFCSVNGSGGDGSSDGGARVAMRDNSDLRQMIELVPHKSDSHLLALELRNSGVLAGILSASLF